MEKRFRLVPNFFVSTPDAPEVIEKLWDFARAAYLDNPMPTLFKERLFVFLSRFCPVRYCLVRHCGFLVGYGHSSGDPDAGLQTIDQVIKLLTTPPPWHRPLDPIYESLEAIKAAIRLACTGQRRRRLDVCGRCPDFCGTREVRAREKFIATGTWRQTL